MPTSRSAPVQSFCNRRDHAGHRQGRPNRDISNKRQVVAFEALESREFLSVSHDASGFTNVTPGASTRVVYVSSSSGRDTNTGLSSVTPVKTLARAKTMMRSGTGDQMLLKRGDTWYEGLGFWTISGQSAAQPAVIGAYGTGARPNVVSGSQNGITMAGTKYTHDVAIMGIKLDATGRGYAMPDGITSAGGLTGLLVEDCQISNYRNNITLQSFFSTVSNVTVRRSVITDSYATASHSQGMYAEGVHGILLEDDVFDHNGWGHGAPQTMFNHDAYITGTSSGLVARDNIFANASSHGLQARPGGIIQNNLFLNDAIGLSYGLVNGDGLATAGGVTGTIDGNVFMGGHSINGTPAGIGMQVSNIKSAVISNNVLANGDATAKNPAITLLPGKPSNYYSQVGINNLNITGNAVYNWYLAMTQSGLSGTSGPAALKNLSLSNNNFVNWGSAVSSAAAKSRTVATYAASIGAVASNDGFLAKARTLSRSSWNGKFTAAGPVAYIRSALGKGGSIPTVTTPTSTPTPTPTPTATPTPTPTATTSGTPSLYVNNVALLEGASGKKPFTFTISLSSAATKNVTIKWGTLKQTATPGSDYTDAAGSVVFTAGQRTKTVSVYVNGDKTKEANETFLFRILSATGASVKTWIGVGKIITDD